MCDCFQFNYLNLVYIFIYNIYITFIDTLTLPISAKAYAALIMVASDYLCIYKAQDATTRVASYKSFLISLYNHNMISSN